MQNCLDRLPRRIRDLLGKTAGGRAPICACKTRTLWDVGQWFRDAPVWAGLCEDALLLCAAGKNPLSASLPLKTLRESAYNAVTGELILAPAPDAPLPGVALPPVEGEALAAVLRGEAAPQTLSNQRTKE